MAIQYRADVQGMFSRDESAMSDRGADRRSGEADRLGAGTQRDPHGAGRSATPQKLVEWTALGYTRTTPRWLARRSLHQPAGIIAKPAAGAPPAAMRHSPPRKCGGMIAAAAFRPPRHRAMHCMMLQAGASRTSSLVSGRARGVVFSCDHVGGAARVGQPGGAVTRIDPDTHLGLVQHTTEGACRCHHGG
jgi:hypothetical protein